MPLPTVARFAGRFPTSASWLECWPVLTSRPDGYATFGDGRAFDGEVYVHRIVYRAVCGNVPEGFEVDHLCFVRNCANPFHLRAITLAENRRHHPERERVTHCPRQHPMSGENLYENPRTGQRACRECTRAATRRYHFEHRDELNAKRAARRQVA